MPPRLASLSSLGRIAEFDILGRLAVGGMAEIYLAREHAPRVGTRELVVKRMLAHVARDPRVREMFLQEPRLSMRLRHANICPIYAFGEHLGTPYLAMEWVDGVSLRALMDRAKGNERLPIPLVLRIVADVASALHYAYTATDENGNRLRVVHRDVTPENIMISYDGAVKLLDFGIAKTHDKNLTQLGELKGKLGYISPEQYRGEALDGRSDVFSLGVCLYEALTGESLYVRGSQYETVLAVMTQSDVPDARTVRPEVSEALQAILDRALDHRVDARYADADEMHAALCAVLASRGDVVRETDLATYVRHVFADERERGPKLDRDIVLAAETTHPVDSLELDHDVDIAERRLSHASRRKHWLVVGLAALAVALMLAWSAVKITSTRGTGSTNSSTGNH